MSALGLAAGIILMGLFGYAVGYHHGQIDARSYERNATK